MRSLRDRRRSHHGFLLVESLVGLSLFAIFLSAVGMALLMSYESSREAGDRVRAVTLSEMAIEGAKSMRDESFGSLPLGQHGIKVGSGAVGARWMLEGAKQMTADGFETSLLVEQVEAGRLRLTATTLWNRGVSSSGSIVLTTDITDWRGTKSIGNWAAISLVGQYTDAGTPLFNDIAISGTYAFVTSEVSDGGKGLYVFDISTPVSPVRVASSFDLGYAGYELAVKGTTLYVLTGDGSQEIRAYDISAPSSLSSGNLRTSYNLPGSGRARALTISQNTLFLTAAQDGTEAEVYAFDITNASAIVLRDSEQESGNIEDTHVTGVHGYLASGEDGSELRVGNVANPADMRFPSGSGYNLTDTLDGLAVFVAGTAAVLGRSAGAAIEELVLFQVSSLSPVPKPPPGPWFHEAGGNVNTVQIEPGSRLAFVASAFVGKQLRVMDLAAWRSGGAPEKGYYSATGDGRGLFYDAWADRVYLVTNSQFLILRPG